MNVETGWPLNTQEKVWIGCLTRAREPGTFYRFFRWFDNAGHPQITLCRNDGGKETYNPRHTLVELEHQPEKPSVDHFSTEYIGKINLRIHPTYKIFAN